MGFGLGLGFWGLGVQSLGLRNLGFKVWGLGGKGSGQFRVWLAGFTGIAHATCLTPRLHGCHCTTVFLCFRQKLIFELGSCQTVARKRGVDHWGAFGYVMRNSVLSKGSPNPEPKAGKGLARACCSFKSARFRRLVKT